MFVVLAACGASSDLDPPVVRTFVGPAAGQPSKRVVALRPTCGTFGVEIVETGAHRDVVDAECTKVVVDGVAERIRARLDFVGYTVIDADKLNAITATRHEVQERTDFYKSDVSKSTGATFEDATPREQTAMLHDIGADALLTTRVWVGAAIGISTHRNVIVQTRLTSAADHRLMWARRCEFQIGGLLAMDVEAIDRATRCVADQVPPP